MGLFSKEHISLIKSLIKHQVKFIIIGGHAAIFYGVNRNTGDLDILIEPTAENGLRLIKALKELNLEVPDFENEEFTKNLVLSFGLEPDAVDIINFTPGIEFSEVFQSAVETEFSELKVRIIDLRSLIKNKEALKRTGDKAHLDKYDIAVLKKILINKG